jgi:hypothetical protein
MGKEPALERWSDRIHPVIVKELRQTVRSGTVLASMQLEGLLLLGTMLTRFGGLGGNVPLDSAIGKDLFQLLVALSFSLTLILIVFSASTRILDERIPGEIDLLYTTPLEASSIIRAKLFCGLYEALLHFSMALPALFLCTLLRGVDVVSVLISLIVAIPLLLAPLQAMIFVGTLRAGRSIKGILGILGFAVSFPVCVGVFAICVNLLIKGGPSGLFSAFVSSGGIGVMFIYVAVLGVMHGMSIALIATPGGRQPRVFEVREMDDTMSYRF